MAFAAAALNNLDASRNYGSAGDELENIPAGYLRNLNRAGVVAVPTLPPVPPSNAPSDTDSLHKPWIESDLNIPAAAAAAAAATTTFNNQPNKIRNNGECMRRPLFGCLLLACFSRSLRNSALSYLYSMYL